MRAARPMRAQPPSRALAMRAPPAPRPGPRAGPADGTGRRGGGDGPRDRDRRGREGGRRHSRRLVRCPQPGQGLPSASRRAEVWQAPGVRGEGRDEDVARQSSRGDHRPDVGRRTCPRAGWSQPLLKAEPRLVLHLSQPSVTRRHRQIGDGVAAAETVMTQRTSGPAEKMRAAVSEEPLFR